MPPAGSVLSDSHWGVTIAKVAILKIEFWDCRKIPMVSSTFIQENTKVQLSYNNFLTGKYPTSLVFVKIYFCKISCQSESFKLNKKKTLTATTHIKRQLISSDYSYQATTHIKRLLISSDNSYQATTHIKRQLISSDNSYQAISHMNQNSYQKIKIYIGKFNLNN